MSQLSLLGKQRRSFLLHYVALLLLLMSSCSVQVVKAEMQATWTPNEQDQAQDGSGPLPLSMKQRQELLQLEQAILQAPDPEATLAQVAAANEMDPRELAGMLARNRRDLEQGGAGGMPSGGGNNIWQSLAATGAAVGQWAQRHPRTAVAVGTTVAMGAYTTWSLPRTGLVVSTRKSVWSKGATTVFAPPVAYLEQAMVRNAARPLSVTAAKEDWAKQITMESASVDKDDGQAIWLDKKTQLPKAIRQAVTATSVLTADDLRGAKFENTEADVVLEAAWEQAVDTVVGQRTLTEFCTAGDVRFFVDPENDDDDDEYSEEGILVVRGLGDWARHGLVPVRRVSPTAFDAAEDSTVALTLHTVQGAHWDGQIHVQLDLQPLDTEDDDEEEEEEAREDCLVVRVTLLIPKKGKAPPRKIAQRIVQAIHDSVVTSIRTRTRQTLARQSQSVRFQTAARNKASTRRGTRAAKERALEEMAADRRRRWQRDNPNSGSYRPSGDRMRSPNNAVYH